MKPGSRPTVRWRTLAQYKTRHFASNAPFHDVERSAGLPAVLASRLRSQTAGARSRELCSKLGLFFELHSDSDGCDYDPDNYDVEHEVDKK